jgi:uncharacterized protein YgfB (UPF0149 family)
VYGTGRLPPPAVREAKLTDIPRLVRAVSETQLPALSAVESEIRRLQLSVSASELHGSVCGWLAGGGEGGADWLARVMADPQLPAVAAGSPLETLRDASAAQLANRSFEFELLLPSADADLVERSGALFDWCRGFVGAFGLAAGDKALLSEDSSEALADLVRLAGAQAQEEGDEEDEEALVEIEEFVRVAVLLLHGDCVLAPKHRQQFN